MKKNKPKTIDELSIIEIKAEIYDRQQIMQRIQNEINILSKSLNEKIESEKQPVSPEDKQT